MFALIDDGEITPNGVDKYGMQEMEEGRLYGDTVYMS